jgi:hypothetical protein
MPSTRLPPLVDGLPESFGHLLAEWENKELASFRTLKFPPGDHALGQRYAKRKYLFDTIVRKQPAGQSLKESARLLDVERGRTSLNKRYTELKKVDSFIVRRQKRRNPDDTPPRGAAPAPPAPPPIRRNVRYRAPQAARGRGFVNGPRMAREAVARRQNVAPLAAPPFVPPMEATGMTSGQRFVDPWYRYR